LILFEAEDVPEIASAGLLLVEVIRPKSLEEGDIEVLLVDEDVVDVVETRLLLEDKSAREEVVGQLETLVVTVRGVPTTVEVPVSVMVVVEMSVRTCVEDTLVDENIVV